MILSGVEEILRAERVTAKDLHTIWNQRLPVPNAPKTEDHEAEARIAWMQEDAVLIERFVAHALEVEEYLLVCDAAREAAMMEKALVRDHFAVLARIRLHFARALCRLGNMAEARAQLLPWVDDLRLGTKIMSSMHTAIGDAYRDEAPLKAGRMERLDMVKAALVHYRNAKELDASNVHATLSCAAAHFLLEEHEPARQDAMATITLVERIAGDSGDHFDLRVAQAHALAILRRPEEARAAYASLKGLPGVSTRSLADARYYADILERAASLPAGTFRDAFPRLDVIVFAGHMPDLDEKRQRFPPSRVDEVRRMIAEKLEELGARSCIASAAAGGDLLFLDEMRKRGASVHIVLPWSRAEFKRTSVDPHDKAENGGQWGALFDSVLDGAASVRELGQLFRPSSDLGKQFSVEVMSGMALVAARISRMDVLPMVLWDGEDGPPGGTEDFASFWQDLKIPPVVLKLDARSRNVSLRKRKTVSQQAICQQAVKSMLFADIVGYSRLSEEAIPEFIEKFLHQVSKLAANSKNAPISLNTWGDAVYAVFDFAAQAGGFALELVRMIAQYAEDWKRSGLCWELAGAPGEPPKVMPLNIRVGLHTGPVFMHFNPVIRVLGFTGTHVNRAARIEPVAQPGEVFASEEFAALAEIEDRRAEIANSGSVPMEFSCEFAGSMKLAKNFPGRFRLYRLLARKEIDIEALAMAAHERFCEKAYERNETVVTTPALRPWTELSEDLREANRAQVADIPRKLKMLGYEVAPHHGIDADKIEITAAQLEQLSIHEHDRWMEERMSQGWTYAPVRDNVRKHHPLLVPWEALSEPDREKDREAVRNTKILLAKAGFRVRKLG